MVTRLYEKGSLALSLIRSSGETRAHRSPSARPAFLTVCRLLYSADSFHSASPAEFCSAYVSPFILSVANDYEPMQESSAEPIGRRSRFALFNPAQYGPGRNPLGFRSRRSKVLRERGFRDKWSDKNANLREMFHVNTAPKAFLFCQCHRHRVQRGTILQQLPRHLEQNNQKPACRPHAANLRGSRHAECDTWPKTSRRLSDNAA